MTYPRDIAAQLRPFHPGFRTGTRQLLAWLRALEESGIAHVALDLRFNQAEFEGTLERLASDILSTSSE